MYITFCYVKSIVQATRVKAQNDNLSMPPRETVHMYAFKEH